MLHSQLSCRGLQCHITRVCTQLTGTFKLFKRGLYVAGVAFEYPTLEAHACIIRVHLQNPHAGIQRLLPLALALGLIHLVEIELLQSFVDAQVVRGPRLQLAGLGDGLIQLSLLFQRIHLGQSSGFIDYITADEQGREQKKTHQSCGQGRGTGWFRHQIAFSQECRQLVRCRYERS